MTKPTSTGTLATATVLAGILYFPIAVWFLMLGMGMLHGVIPAVPALGYWHSLTASVGLMLVYGTVGYSQGLARVYYRKN
jgi:hypothetical protein